MGKFWDAETVYTDVQEYFAAVIASIDQAQELIQFESYIFDADDIGLSVLHALKRASSRGVTVQLLLDGFGSYHWSYKDAEEWANSFFQIRFFHPMPWQYSSAQFWRVFMQFKFSFGLSKFVRRNHRKICLVDRKVCFLGGLNVTKNSWKDAAVRLEGKDILLISAAMEQSWRRHQSLRIPFPKQKTESTPHVRLNFLWVDRYRNYRNLLNSIREAKKRVWISSAYFVPKFSLIRVLMRAQAKGVDVRIVSSKKTDVFLMNYANKTFFPILLANGIKVFEYSDGFIHSKLTLIDDSVWIGSSNLNQRSLRHDLEIDVLLDSKSSLKAIEQDFENNMNSSVRLTLQKWNSRSWVVKLFETIGMIFKNWI